MENWKPVVGYEGYYEVSDCGEVRSLPRETTLVLDGKTYTRLVRGVELKPYRTNSGHLRINLNRSGKVVRGLIHRLVLESFVGPCPDGMECCHWDGDPGNNNLENLRWGTHKENFADSVRLGVMGEGSCSGNTRLTKWEVQWIKRFLKHGFAKQDYLAEIFGVAKSTISAISVGRNWGWLEVEG